ncbi:ribonuclease T2 [Nitrosomonas sp. Is79A3]|uniref:ribonuclease T2 family protein n=1 Tax=Nitrosomonas sp. (strain Is79A3) TaxID=261292 RepID=UPI000215D4B8
MIFLRKSTFFQVFLVILIIGYAHSAAAKTLGIFSAQQSCPAYVSKNKLTNPDNTQILADKKYDIIEANKPDHASWYRVILPTANPKERWISADCGDAQLSGGQGTGDNGNSSSCSITGEADSHVLALSWQPAFCETKPQKPECKITDPQVYQAKHFTLHGLWPNKKSCDTHYAFCGDVKAQKQNFCDYPEIKLNPTSQASLAEVMPSVTAGSCLERHEWHKHGTCQSAKSIEEFFDLSVDLARQFNDSGMAYFMNRRIGQQVRTEDFLNRIAAVLGSAARDRIKLNCDQGMLVEIQLSLIADLTPGADLEKLIVNAPAQSNSNCGETFRVDPIGQ